VTNIDATGEITEGFYYFVLDRSKPGAASLSAIVTPDLLLLKQIPTGFNGAIIKYDLNNNVLASTHIENGKIEKNKQDIISKTKANKDTPGKQATPNIAPSTSCDGGVQYCIDWYWQTWIDGVLVYEEYLYTTCSCTLSTGGGGGGGEMSCEQKNVDFINMEHPEDGPVSESTISFRNRDWNKGYNWLIFSAGPWGLISYEQANLKKIHYSSNNLDIWEFQTFQHLSVLETGMNVGGSRTFTIVPPIINISPSKTSVNIHIDYTVSSKAECIPGVPLAHPFNSNKSFYAPNNIVITP